MIGFKGLGIGDFRNLDGAGRIACAYTTKNSTPCASTDCVSLSQSCTGGIGSETSRIRHHVVNLAIAGASGAAESLFPSCWLTVSVYPPWFITEPGYETTGRFAW